MITFCWQRRSAVETAVLCCHCHANDFSYSPFNWSPRIYFCHCNDFSFCIECDQIHPWLCVSLLERIKWEIRDTTLRRILSGYLFTFLSYLSAVWWPLVEHFYLHFVSSKMNKNFSHAMRGALHRRTQHRKQTILACSTKWVRRWFLCRPMLVLDGILIPLLFERIDAKPFLFWQITKINILLAHEHLCSKFQWVNLINLPLGSSIRRPNKWLWLTFSFRYL